MTAKAIRVMIIDDSIFFRDFMSRSLNIDLLVGVVAVAANIKEAIQNIPFSQPNIILLDIDTGITTDKTQLKNNIALLHSECPHIPIIALSPCSDRVFESLKAGAADFVEKPNALRDKDHARFIIEITEKLKNVFATPVHPGRSSFRKSSISSETFGQSAVANAAPPHCTPLFGRWTFSNVKDKVIAIGASTGGTEAILEVIKDLPANTPGIVIVQHMPPDFTKMYAERLNKNCVMNVKEAQNADRVQPGQIIVAKGDMHLSLAKDLWGYYVKVAAGEKVSGHCPSVDVLFESVAQTAKENAIGILLTGMGSDGAKSLLKMREAGAYTIGQDESTCVVYGMPMAAYNIGAVVDQLPLHLITDAVLNHLSG